MVRTQTPSRAMGPQGCSAHPFPGLLCLHCWYLHTHTHRSTLSPRLGELSLTLEKFVYANLASAVFSHQVKWPTTHRHDLQDTHGSPWSAQEGWGHHWHSVTPRSPPGHLSSWTWPRAEAGEAAQEGWSWHISSPRRRRRCSSSPRGYHTEQEGASQTTTQARSVAGACAAEGGRPSSSPPIQSHPIWSRGHQGSREPHQHTTPRAQPCKGSFSVLYSSPLSQMWFERKRQLFNDGFLADQGHRRPGNDITNLQKEPTGHLEFSNQQTHLRGSRGN